jgi:hypothetical protein
MMMKSKAAPGSAMIVHKPSALTVIDKPIVNYEGEILFMPPQSMKTVKISKDAALTAFSRLCFALGVFVLLKGYLLSALTPI